MGVENHPSEITPTIEIVTPAMAAEYLTNNIQCNRNLHSPTVDYYARQMTKGLWLFNGQTITFDVLGRLIDGQHRLQAVMKSGKPQKFVVIRGADLDAFRTIDTGKTRSPSDVLSIEGVPNAIQAAAAVKFYMALHQGRADTRASNKKYSDVISPATISKFYKSHSDLVQEALSIANRYYRAAKWYSVAQLSGTVIFAHLDLKCSLDESAAFFRSLYDEEIQPAGAVKLLREILKKNYPHDRAFTPAYRYELLKKTWNFVRNHRTPKQLQWSRAQEGFIKMV